MISMRFHDIRPVYTMIFDANSITSEENIEDTLIIDPTVQALGKYFIGPVQTKAPGIYRQVRALFMVVLSYRRQRHGVCGDV